VDAASEPRDGAAASIQAGPTRRAGERVDVIDRLQDVRVLDLDGGELRLGALWAERTLVLVFLRHYG